MTDTLLPSTTSPVVVLEAAHESVAGLLDTLWAARAAGELLDTVRAVERLRSVMDRVQLGAIAEIEATRAAVTEGWGSTRDFVTATTGCRVGDGRRLVALATTVTRDRAATGEALAAGELSRPQAEVIVAAVDRLPGDPALREAAERLLIAEARTRDASELSKVGRYLLERLDPDGAERRAERDLEREERAAHAGRFLSITEDGIGGVRVTGRGTVEDAAVVKAVLSPLSAPQPTAQPGECGGTPGAVAGCGVADCAHDGRDPREHGTRFWDALVEACRLLAGTQSLPTSHGARPRIGVTISLADLQAFLSDHEDEPIDEPAADPDEPAAADGDLGDHRGFRSDHEGEPIDEPAADPDEPAAADRDLGDLEKTIDADLSCEKEAAVDRPTDRDGKGAGDGVGHLAGRGDLDIRPAGRTGVGHLDSGGTMSAAAVRRLACDADILPLVLGSQSQLLDVGRTRRPVTVGIWNALVVRDRHCAFPGCTRPPIGCDAHHILHWADGGPTSLTNLVMLCRTHHTVIHTTPWQVRLNRDDHRPEFLAPPRLDPLQRPIRRRPLRL